MISTVSGVPANVGRAAIRAVDAHPALELAAVLVHNPDKAARDAGELGGLDHELGVAATDDIDRWLAASPRAVVYAASGDIRPEGALADITRAIRAGAAVVTPALYALYDQRSAPPELREPSLRPSRTAAARCSSPASTPAGQRLLPLLISGLGTTIDVIRCQEIFDYTTYDQQDAVRYLVRHGSRWTTSRRCSRRRCRPWCGAGRYG